MQYFKHTMFGVYSILEKLFFKEVNLRMTDPKYFYNSDCHENFILVRVTNKRCMKSNQKITFE